jgi:hypothetical protein
MTMSKIATAMQTSFVMEENVLSNGILGLIWNSTAGT